MVQPIDMVNDHITDPGRYIYITVRLLRPYAPTAATDPPQQLNTDSSWMGRTSDLAAAKDLLLNAKTSQWC